MVTTNTDLPGTTSSSTGTAPGGDILPTTPPVGPLAGEPTTPVKPVADGTKTFTQAELDSVVQERLKREREASAAKYGDYDDFKAAAAKLKTIEDANKTEAERTVAALEEAQRKLADAEAKRLELEAEVAAGKRISRVSQIALTLGAIDPQDANFLVETLGIDPDDNDKLTGVLSELKKAKPYLFKAGGNNQNTVETFNPGGATGQAETDSQRMARLRQATGQTGNLFR